MTMGFSPDIKRGQSEQKCPKCGSTDIYKVETYTNNHKVVLGNYCRNCLTEYTDGWEVLQPMR